MLAASKPDLESCYETLMVWAGNSFVPLTLAWTVTLPALDIRIRNVAEPVVDTFSTYVSPLFSDKATRAPAGQ